jgi:hypothetical protein
MWVHISLEAFGKTWERASGKDMQLMSWVRYELWEKDGKYLMGYLRYL